MELVAEKMKKEKELICLTHISPGKSGIVAEIHGGQGAVRRLEALGLRIGSKITKISAQFMHGPITVKVGQTSLALGHGLAHKVMVDLSAGPCLPAGRASAEAEVQE